MADGQDGSAAVKVEAPPSALQQRLDAARARAVEARAALTPAIKAQADLLEQIDEAEAEAREADAKVRKVALSEMIETARDVFPNETLEPLDLEGRSAGAGLYVLRKAPRAALAVWNKAIAKAPNDTDKHRLSLALKCVVAFNGEVRPVSEEEQAAFEAQLRACWIEYDMATLTIVNVGLRLSGFAMEEAKS